MNETIFKMKDLVMLLITGLVSVVTNFDYAFMALFVGFVFNFVCGLLAAAKGREGFDMGKAKDGVVLFLFYIGVVFVLYALTYFKGIHETLIVYFTLIVGYFYVTNGFRNMNKAFPNDRAIAFIYEVLSTEIFFRLKEYLGLKKKSDDNEPA